MKNSKMLWGFAIVMFVAVIALACYAAILTGYYLGQDKSAQLQQEALSTPPEPVVVVITATELVPSQTPSPVPPPVSTSTSTPAPIPTVEGLNCYDQATIEYLIRNNELMQKFSRIEKEGLSHFKKPGKLDGEEFNDVNVKMQNMVADVESLSPPKLLLEFQSYQLGYMRGLEEAFRLGQKGDASGAWAALTSAQWYGGLMNHMSQAYYTCGYRLIP